MSTRAIRWTAIALPAELLEDVDRAARDLGESRSRYITRILRCAVRARRHAAVTRRLDELFADPELASEQRREREHALETEHVEHVGGEGVGAGVRDPVRAAAPHQTAQHEQEPHAPPRRAHRSVRPGGELTNGAAVAARAMDQRLDVARVVDRLLGRKVGEVGRASARRTTWRVFTSS
jgi:hypothetical protein